MDQVVENMLGVVVMLMAPIGLGLWLGILGLVVYHHIKGTTKPP